jgi:hypothetical protein
MRWPTKQAREHLEFIFKVVQAVVVLVGVLWAAYTFWDTRYRELSKPYEEKKLEFYTEAGRVLAHLSSLRERLETPEDGKDSDRTMTELRFWELYWGQLPFVESPEVVGHMVSFCQGYFTKEPERSRCTPDKVSVLPLQETAKKLAEQACKEIRGVWDREPLYSVAYHWFVLQKDPCSRANKRQ